MTVDKLQNNGTCAVIELARRVRAAESQVAQARKLAERIVDYFGESNANRSEVELCNMAKKLLQSQD